MSGSFRRCACQSVWLWRQSAGVPGDAVDELVMSDILRALVGITAARARAFGSTSGEWCGRSAYPIRSCNRSGWSRRTRPSCRSDRSTGGTALRTSSARRSAARSCQCPSYKWPSGSKPSAGKSPFRFDSLVFQSITFANSTRLPASPAERRMVWTNPSPRFPAKLPRPRAPDRSPPLESSPDR